MERTEEFVQDRVPARRPLAHPEKNCGACTLCCKTMGVAELPKPPNRWCDLCVKGKGCTIYDHRPQSCVDFACVWLQSPPAELDDRLRPDRVGVVLCPSTTGRGLIAYCDPQTPTAWRQPLILKLLHRVSRGGEHAGAIAGRRYWTITEKTEHETVYKPE